MKNFYSFTRDELEKELVAHGFKTIHAKQLFEEVYKSKNIEPQNMSKLNKTLKDFVSGFFAFDLPEIVDKKHSIDGTIKFLLKLWDNNIIETVFMRNQYGNSLCVTTQVGCNMGCSFCASGLYQKQRDLSVDEIVTQVIKMEDELHEKINNVVMMGIGEPFDNYLNVKQFVDIISDDFGLQIGTSKITVSTSGIIPKIMEFSHEKKRVNLAVSLHAPNDTLRNELMKINKKYPIDELMKACIYYNQITNKRITFEYILLEHINDEISHALELARLLKDVKGYVNLIRYNTVSEFSYHGSSEDRAIAFHKTLLSNGVTATLRYEKGSDINAACGQLRSERIKSG
jgi:23S rRNA (adenine2503-C2)-methyltransferase